MCPLSSPVYFPCWTSTPLCVSCPLSVFFPLSPSVCQCSHPCLPLVISPVGPPHLFLVLSLVSVYLVCVFPAVHVWSLYLSASVHAPACSQFPGAMCSLGFDFCIFAFWVEFWLVICTLSFSCIFLNYFLCYFVSWSLDLFGFFVFMSFSFG